MIESRHGEVQSAGGLLVGQTLEVTKDDRQALGAGEPFDRVVKDRAHIEIERGTGLVRDSHRRALRFALSPSLGVDVQLDCSSKSHTVQPSAEALASADRTRLACEDKERGLERIFDVVLITQNGAAGRGDHRPVPGHQSLEGRAIASLCVAGEQLGVGEPHRCATAE
jgi:hypothetical protein